MQRYDTLSRRVASVADWGKLSLEAKQSQDRNGRVSGIGAHRFPPGSGSLLAMRERDLRAVVAAIPLPDRSHPGGMVLRDAAQPESMRKAPAQDGCWYLRFTRGRPEGFADKVFGRIRAAVIRFAQIPDMAMHDRESGVLCFFLCLGLTFPARININAHNGNSGDVCMSFQPLFAALVQGLVSRSFLKTVHSYLYCKE
jgi:hypothetical protein